MVTIIMIMRTIINNMTTNNYKTMVTSKAMRMVTFMIMTVIFIIVMKLMISMTIHFVVLLPTRGPMGFMGLLLFVVKTNVFIIALASTGRCFRIHVMTA